MLQFHMYGIKLFATLVFLPQSYMCFDPRILGISITLYCFVDREGGFPLYPNARHVFKNVYIQKCVFFKSFILGISYLMDI